MRDKPLQLINYLRATLGVSDMSYVDIRDFNEQFAYIKVKGRPSSRKSARKWIPTKHHIVDYINDTVCWSQEGGKIFEPDLSELRAKYKLEVGF